MKLPKKENEPQQIQLELPDYSYQYYEWTKKKEQQKQDSSQETVVIIDIY